jgi:cell division protein ZapE
VTGPLAEYQRRVAAGQLAGDTAQLDVIAELERLHRELVAAERRDLSLVSRLGRLIGRFPEGVRGIYLWGSVGRGKTLLMDLFFNCLPLAGKRRQHFHRFMAAVHAGLRELRETENPLDIVADRIAGRCRIICFDEFAVNDIADAMILGNLFAALFDRGVTLAATSNIAPRELYRDGLQRARFLPAIDAIEAHSAVIEIGGDRDYRLRVLEGAVVYQTPDDDEAEAYLARSFTAIAPDEGEGAGTMEVLGRPIDYVRISDGVIWLEFAAVCDGPRSQDDYIEIAREFQTVILSHVPRFDETLENQARRFIALVDEFYDRRVKLILSAAVSLDRLYAGRQLGQVFERTLSRLVEMQSREYFAAAHRP